MGLLTLNDFREELSAGLGQRGYGNDRLDRWINMAYFEVCGAIEFDALLVNTTYSTVADTRTVTLDSGTIGVKSVHDRTNDRELLFRRYKDFNILDPDDEGGKPKIWSRQDLTLYLWPTPDDVYSLSVIRIREPSRLTSGSGVTILPSTWDAAVILFAMHYGHLLGTSNIEHADFYFKRAIAYVSSRRIDKEHDTEAQHAGVNVAWSEEDLTDAQ